VSELAPMDLEFVAYVSNLFHTWLTLFGTSFGGGHQTSLVVGIFVRYFFAFLVRLGCGTNTSENCTIFASSALEVQNTIGMQNTNIFYFDDFKLVCFRVASLPKFEYFENIFVLYIDTRKIP
jgi:hypothetical protein